MSDAYTLYAVSVGGTVIDQIVDQRIDTDVNEMLEGGDSQIDARHVSVTGQVPTVRFTTSNIKAALAAAGVDALVIDEDSFSNAVVLYFRKRAMGGAFAAGAAHVKMTINLGLLYPVTLRAPHPNRAEIEYALACVWDSTNDPVILAALQTVPDLTPGVDAIHTVGPWWINGTGLGDSIQDFTVNFGINIQTVTGSGAIWPTNVHIASRRPDMRCTTLDLSILGATSGLGILGKARSGITRAFLRKKQQGGALVDDATLEHIQFEIAQGRISAESAGGAHEGEATAGILVTPTSVDGVNAPIAYTADVAVSGA